MFRGTNRHETDHMETGRALTKEDTAQTTRNKSIANAIRTSDYPNLSEIYALADELGIMMRDCRRTLSPTRVLLTVGQTSLREPRFEQFCYGQNNEYVERDKNHASVVIWSLGNESTYKIHFVELLKQ